MLTVAQLTGALVAFLLLGSAPAEAGPIDLLLGPVAASGEPASVPGVAAYDALQLQQGAVYAASFPQYPGDIAESNFYDLALALYQLHARTGDRYWRDRARAVAIAWRDDLLNQNIALRLLGWWLTDYVPAPFYLSTLGIALHALDTGDQESRRIVNDHARYVEQYWPEFDGGNGDQRNAGYALMAMVAATVLGDDHRSTAAANAESFLAGERPEGCWETWATPPSLVPAGNVVLNFMNGLAMEALILYDRVLGDARILPAVERCIQWTWATQWVPAAHAFQYANLTSGWVHTNPYANLSGLLLPAWGYAYQRTRQEVYKTQGDQILAGLVLPGADGTYGIYGVKQFDQMFRSSAQYLGYVALRDVVPPPPPDVVTITSPVDGATITRATLTHVEAIVTAPPGTTIRMVRFSLALSPADSVLKHTDKAAPYTWGWRPRGGSAPRTYVLRAEAYSSDGALRGTSKPITVHVP